MNRLYPNRSFFSILRSAFPLTLLALLILVLTGGLSATAATPILPPPPRF